MKFIPVVLLVFCAIFAAGQVEIESVFSLYWEDLRFPATTQTRPGSAANITSDTGDVGLVFETDAIVGIDWVVFNIQMPHGYRFGSEIEPHIHWIQSESNIPNWMLEYRCYDNGEVVPGGAFTQAIWSSNEETYTSGSILQYTEFPGFDPVLSKLSGMCDMKLYRDTDNTSTLFPGVDPFTTDVLLKEFDIHYQSDSLGSATEGSKW